MSIRIQDPLFLLSSQTGISAGQLKVEAAEGNPDVNKPQEALKTGEPIPIIFCRRRNNIGGVMTQPKITEGRFANPITEEDYDYGASTFKQAFQTFQLKYLFVLSEGDLPLLQIRDVFFGNCRVGTLNQKYNGRAGSWSPGNAIDDHFSTVILTPTNGVFSFNVFGLTQGQSARLGNTVYYKSSSSLHQMTYVDSEFPVFCGTSGTYSGLTTLSFEYTVKASENAKIERSLSVFIREGLKISRLVDSVTGPSDNYVDLVKYLFETNNRLASDLIDTAALTIAAKFSDANGFFFNGELKESENLLDWLQQTSSNFLLRLTNANGKFGLMPVLPYNTDHTIKTTAIAPKFTFTEEHVVDNGFEIEYVSLEDREPVCFTVMWRQQPEADFGLVRTVQVRYANEATNGPFMNIDLSSYCTSENHAVKVGAFRLAQRKFITHHLRLTVRERNYNAALVVGDLVRVRLRRETNEGEVEYHDKIYEINRIDKGFASTILYDLTHFPIDSQGRSVIAREVAAAVGAGNTIDVGRSTFDCDENDGDSNTEVGEDDNDDLDPIDDDDTELDIEQPEDGDFEDDFNPPPFDPNDNGGLDEDPIDDDEPQRTIGGYTGTPGLGDVLTFNPGCENPLIKWYKININTGAVTFIGSGISATLEVTAALQQEGVRVYAEGCCPDPSQPGGYAVCKKSDEVELFDEIIDCPGGGQAGGQGTFTKVINVGTAYPASFNFTWTAYTIQDRFVISGAATYDTGFVSGTNVSVSVAKTSANPYITVTVYAPSGGTAWNYSVGCAS